MSQEQATGGQQDGGTGRINRYVGVLAGGAVTAFAARFGAADFARDFAASAWNIDYSDNVRDAGMAITAAAGTGYAAASLLSERSRVANVIADHRRAAIAVGGAGLLLWAGASAVGGVLSQGSETQSQQPETTSPPATVVVEGPIETITDTAPETTTITVNTSTIGYFQPTPSGRPCELYFPFNDPDHVVTNVKLVQGGLYDLAVATGDEALDPGPADGVQGNQTNGALAYWRTTYLGIPEGQVMDLVQCDELPSLTDGRLDTPAGISR